MSPTLTCLLPKKDYKNNESDYPEDLKNRRVGKTATISWSKKDQEREHGSEQKPHGQLFLVSRS